MTTGGSGENNTDGGAALRAGVPMTPEELARFDGSNPNVPVYVAVKGTVFDVTANRDMYAPGKGYSIFAGKDASRALGKSSLKIEDCTWDYSGLNDEDIKTLDQWHSFYSKKYPVIGYVLR